MKIYTYICSLTLALALFIILAVPAFAQTWTAPPANATPGTYNTPPPINVSSAAQTKTGNLTVGNNSVSSIFTVIGTIAAPFGRFTNWVGIGLPAGSTPTSPLHIQQAPTTNAHLPSILVSRAGSGRVFQAATPNSPVFGLYLDGSNLYNILSRGNYQWWSSNNQSLMTLNSAGDLLLPRSLGNSDGETRVVVASPTGLLTTIGANGTGDGECSSAGQVLKWNGSSWECGDVTTSGGADNWGTQVVRTDSTLAGTGIATSLLKVNTSTIQQRVTGTCAVGSSIRVINANGTVSCEVDDMGTSTSSTGDNWGAQVVQRRDQTLVGDGTAGANALGVNSLYVQARVTQPCPSGSAIRVIAQTGDVTCQPIATSTTYTAGSGLTLTGTRFDASTSSALWNANKLLGRPLHTTIAPTPGQVLKWNGTVWAPSADAGTTYTAGTGLALFGTQFRASTTAALWNANQLQGRAVANTPPTTNYVLKWNGSVWAPTRQDALDEVTLKNGLAWYSSLNSFEGTPGARPATDPTIIGMGTCAVGDLFRAVPSANGGSEWQCFGHRSAGQTVDPLRHCSEGQVMVYREVGDATNPARGFFCQDIPTGGVQGAGADYEMAYWQGGQVAGAPSVRLLPAGGGLNERVLVWNQDGTTQSDLYIPNGKVDSANGFFGALAVGQNAQVTGNLILGGNLIAAGDVYGRTLNVQAGIVNGNLLVTNGRVNIQAPLSNNPSDALTVTLGNVRVGYPISGQNETASTFFNSAAVGGDSTRNNGNIITDDIYIRGAGQTTNLTSTTWDDRFQGAWVGQLYQVCPPNQFVTGVGKRSDGSIGPVCSSFQ